MEKTEKDFRKKSDYKRPLLNLRIDLVFNLIRTYLTNQCTQAPIPNIKMQASIRLFAIASVMMGLATVQAVPVEEASVVPREIDGYEIVQAKWEIPINAQGDVQEFTGTVQEVHDQILKINPNFDSEVLGAPGNDDSEELEARELEVRTDWTKTIVNCNDHARTAKHLFADANKALYRMVGRPSLPGGKSTCSKVSCSSGASIYWCNNSGKAKTLNGYTSIYQGANRVINICSAKSYSFSGTVFHSTKWSVVLKDTDKC